jgi:uncharacterized protein (DUF362 family)
VMSNRESLAKQACPDGGWGYAPGQESHLEPTCLALLALHPERERFASVIDKARAWLSTCARDDGSYRLPRGRAEAVWSMALVLFVQAVLGEERQRLEHTASTLLAYRGRQIQKTEKDLEINDVDGDLIGWPWAENNFSWVEPTAWACLALQRLGQGQHPRVREGIRLLLDRTLDQGGVNYGNRHIFGISLEPIPTPTALMLLAIQHEPDTPQRAAAVRYLQQQGQSGDQGPSGDDLEHLCWARLALDRYRAHPEVEPALQALGQRIEAAQRERAQVPWLRPNLLRDALACLALGIDQSNPFQLPREQATPLEPRSLLPRKPSLGQRFRAAFQGLALQTATRLRPLEPQADVHIAPAGDYNADLADVVQRQYDHFREQVPLKGKRVVLKPNLVEYHRDKVINTHPHVVGAVIELCLREGASEVIVAEGPGHWRNVEYLVGASGLGDVLRHHKVSFVDLNHDDPVRKLNPSRLTKLEHLYLSRTIVEADVVISLPKLKTHHWAVATLSLKNLFGTLPGICYGWPKNELHWRGIDNSIVDIAVCRTPDLALVDGIIGMEGDGPLNGKAKPMGVLIVGTDLVAVDATCCRLMQLDAARVPYLVLAHRHKVGHLTEGQIRQVGETISSRAQPFETVDFFQTLWTGRAG